MHARCRGPLLLAMLLALASPARADSPQAVDAPPVPLLWKVSAPGATPASRDVYLLGSFHLLRPSDYPLSPDVDAAFADAESLLFEVAPDALTSPSLALDMGRAALRTDGSTLAQQLPPATRQKLQAWSEANAAALASAGLGMDALQHFDAWFVGLTISMSGMAAMGLEPALGLDRHFGEAAADAGKPAEGLETAAQQIAFLDRMDAAEQVQFLDEALDNSLEGDADVEQLHALWRAGDGEGLWNGMGADMRRKYPRLYAHINVERNDTWLPMLERRVSAQDGDDTLVVVGALHLLGRDGLVDKLRARGYGVTRICSACDPTSALP